MVVVAIIRAAAAAAAAIHTNVIQSEESRSERKKTGLSILASITQTFFFKLPLVFHLVWPLFSSVFSSKYGAVVLSYVTMIYVFI